MNCGFNRDSINKLESYRRWHHISTSALHRQAHKYPNTYVSICTRMCIDSCTHTHTHTHTHMHTHHTHIHNTHIHNTHNTQTHITHPYNTHTYTTHTYTTHIHNTHIHTHYTTYNTHTQKRCDCDHSSQKQWVGRSITTEVLGKVWVELGRPRRECALTVGCAPFRAQPS